MTPTRHVSSLHRHTRTVRPEDWRTSWRRHSLVERRSLPADLVGEIVIVDDGIRIDLLTIRRGWLTVSLSHKLEMKKAGRVAAKNRTPLGDKGLGRLGAQRLGDQLRT